MALVKDRRRQDYANYEQQAPGRDIHFRQANSYNSQQGYGASDFECDNVQCAREPYIIQQPNMAQQFMANYFQNQARNYDVRGNIPPYQQVDHTGTYNLAQDYRYNSYMNDDYDRDAQPSRVDSRRRVRAKKKTMNSSMIKIVVAIMAVALLICGLLIANQFIGDKEASAESEIIQPIDSALVTSAYAVDGSSETLPTMDVLPEYEYEQSSNWFDKVCDFFGGKLK